MAERDVLRLKAEQYDSVVEVLKPADGGRYRADTIARIEALIARAERAEAEAAGLREDAERYRWLKQGGYEHADDGHPHIVVHRQGDYGNWHDAIIEDDEADTAIDAARGLEGR